jgi:hypothetical protein
MYDKELHIVTSFVLTMLLKSQMPKHEAMASAFGMGLAKEFILDSYPDHEDIIANGIGVGLTILF